MCWSKCFFFNVLWKATIKFPVDRRSAFFSNFWKWIPCWLIAAGVSVRICENFSQSFPVTKVRTAGTHGQDSTGVIKIFHPLWKGYRFNHSLTVLLVYEKDPSVNESLKDSFHLDSVLLSRKNLRELRGSFLVRQMVMRETSRMSPRTR